MGHTLAIKALLIHSPLVGPSTLAPLGNELRARGFDVVVPDLRPALRVPGPHWRSILDLACAQGDSFEVLVGHSGAGVLLPSLADRLAPGVVAFVDAVVPADGPSHHPSHRFIEFIDTLPRNGPLLPPWHEWWDDDVMADLVPDAELRERIAADTPSVPRSFYDDHVPLPAGWMTGWGCCYLQLSPPYDDDCARADTYGWPTTRLDGRHLDVAVKPAEVASALDELIDRVRLR